MRQVLHYLKFDFLRWRWLVVALWGLVALHSGLFLTAELVEDREWVDFRTGSERVLSEIVEMLANGILLWAVALVVIAGAADSPVRRRTWLLTRAGERRLRAASRLGFVLLTVVLPLAMGYAVMPLIAGFDALTVLHSFWLALKIAVPLAAALWLWVRAWPHLPALILGVLMILSPGVLVYAAGLRLPVEWFALRPSLLTMIFCLALPALVCLRAAGKEGRRAAAHSCAAGLLLPVIWVGGGAVSYWLRTAFPGRLERAVFGSGAEWTLHPASDVQLGKDLLLRSDVRFPTWSGGAVASTPAVNDLQILATSWQRRGELGWSAWKDAEGRIDRAKDLLPDSRLAAAHREGLVLRLTNFDREGLSGEEFLDLRLKAQVTLLEKKNLQVLPPDAGTEARGHGWTYHTKDPGAAFGLRHQRGRVAPGMGVAEIVASRGPTSESGWYPGQGRYRGKSWWLPGYHFANREWDALWEWRDRDEADRLARAPVHLVVAERETCLRIVRVESVRVVINAPPNRLPRSPRSAPAEQPEQVEPFLQHVSNVVWPRGNMLSVPAGGAYDHEVAYFIHWLKSQKSFLELQQAALLVPAWQAQFLEIAALERLHPANALLQVLSAGLPEEHRGELLALLPKATWLTLVVEQRGWQAEAKPLVLESARRLGRIHDDFILLVLGYRDPNFNKWLLKAFKLDVPTVLYWESMPELVAVLPSRLKGEAQQWSRLEQQGLDALLTAGSPDYLTELLKGLSNPYHKHRAASHLYSSVVDAAGNSPPPTGLKMREDGRPDYSRHQSVAPEFLQWFAGLTADDFTFDRKKHRFVRKSAATKVP